MNEEHDKIDWQRAVVRAEEAMPTAFAHLAALHYAKALCKHPRFADYLYSSEYEVEGQDAKKTLEEVREKIRRRSASEDLPAPLLVECEIFESLVARLDGDHTAAISELYDAIAVVMRMIAVLEEKQDLNGNIKQEGK